jgi:hypothetical protein
MLSLRSIGLPLCFFVLALPLRGQPAAAAPAAPTPLLYIVGASVSGGFRDGPMTDGDPDNETFALTRLLKAWAATADVRVKNQSETMLIQMFTKPAEIGEKQIDAAKKAQATLVVGIDFLFWFAYGRIAGDEVKDRAAKLETGLAMLASLPATTAIVVGDLPDMRGAAPRMLSPSWIPAPEMLKTLNARIAEFAKAHANVHVFPLADTVKAMRGDGVELALAAGTLRAGPAALLQGDKLHVNRLGAAMIGERLCGYVCSVLPKDHPLRKVAWKLETFVETTGAVGDVEALRAAKQEAAPGKGTGKGKCAALRWCTAVALTG